jgi:iron complex outermembrane receptor protein
VEGNKVGNETKQKLKKGLFEAIAVALFSIVSTGQVLAQGLLEEIIVTASKRGEQKLQDVPASIAALNQEDLERMGAENFADFAANIAGLDLIDSGPGNKQYMIRGINGAGEAQVGVYYDNMPITGMGASAAAFGGTQTDFDLFDTERVEVLRGPQGTLYGANSMSGVVRIIANKPQAEEFELNVEGDASSISKGGDSYNGKVMVNIPLIKDKLAFRAVAYHKEYGGFVDAIDLPADYNAGAGDVDDPTVVTKDVNANDTQGLRLGLTAWLSDSTTLSAQYFYQDLDAGSTPNYRPNDAVNVLTGVTFFGAGDLNTVNYVTPLFEDETHMGNITLEHDFGWAALTASASEFDREVFLVVDTTTSFKNFGLPSFVAPGGALQTSLDGSMQSYEMRLSTQFEGKFNALVGVFRQDREIKLNSVANISFVPNVLDPNATIFHRVSDDETEISAVFGEVTYQVTDKLALLAGFRYFKTKRAVESQLIQPFFGPPIPEPVENFSTDETDSLFKFSISYDFTNDLLAYGEFSEGYRAGGTNSAQVAGIPGTYEADYSTNYELGLKSTLLDGRVTLNSSVYHIVWSDMQVARCFNFAGNPDPTCPFDALVNTEGDVAEATGIEVDLAAQVTPQLMVTSALSYNDTELTQDLSVIGGGALAVEGASMLGTRQFTFAASAEYNFPIMDNWNGFARIDYQYLGDVENFSWTIQNVPGDSYDNVNLRLGADNENFSVALYATNVTDTRAQLNASNGFGIAGGFTSNQPRTLGLNVGWKF